MQRVALALRNHLPRASLGQLFVVPRSLAQHGQVGGRCDFLPEAGVQKGWSPGSCCMELGFQVSPSGEGPPGTLAPRDNRESSQDPSAQDMKCEDTWSLKPLPYQTCQVPGSEPESWSPSVRLLDRR